MDYNLRAADKPWIHPRKGELPCQVRCRAFAPFFRKHSAAKPRRQSGSVACPNTWYSASDWCCGCTISRSWGMRKRAAMLACRDDRCSAGGNAGLPGTFLSAIFQGGAASPLFPPLEEAQVKAVACEAVFQTQQPISRQSLADLTRRCQEALGRPISRSTVWRILHTDAIKPWQFDYWIFPRDPHFAEKAGRIVDLYAGLWQGNPLTAKDCILSSDEKTSIQARLRRHPGSGPGPHRRRRVEFEYERGGALQYLAAWDVQRGYVMGRCEAKTGIEPFGRLVAQVMEQEPYRSAERVFWVVDNGSSHRGETSEQRLIQAYANAVLVHTPVHASWLNQVEIYFSMVQRKVLTPNDFSDLREIETRLRLYEELTNRTPRPFQWKFDRRKLAEFLQRLEARRCLQGETSVTQGRS
jgi:DDE superfamily endonuclease